MSTTTAATGVRRSGSTITYYFESGHEFSYPLSIHPYHRFLDMLDSALDDLDGEHEGTVIDVIMRHKKALSELPLDDDPNHDEVHEAINFLRCFWT